MRINELTAYHVRIPLRRKIRHASHTRTDTDTIIVRCRLDDGTIGWGEGLPRPYVTGETIEGVFDLLRATDWKRQLGGPISNLSDAIALCEQIQLAGIPAGMRDCYGNSLRCALEIGILDAVCRKEGTPLSTVTALVPEAAGVRKNSEEVQYSATITSMGVVKQILRSWIYWYYGFHFMKVKVGVAGVNDAAILRRIRLHGGRGFDLRIDANEAWTCENLEAKLKPLERYRISSVEQPVPHEHVDGLAAVRNRIETPIMLDESLCSLGDAHRAIEKGTCDLFNIRLSKCGGFVNSLRIAAIAKRAGLNCQLGCQVGETGILSAAGRHFATSVGDLRYLEGSYDRFLVGENRLTVEDLTFGRGGFAKAITGPGLGVQLDPQSIERVRLAEEHWSID